MTEVAALVPAIGGRERPVDGMVAALAQMQHGVVAHRQLIELGLGPDAVQHRVDRARLHRVHIGAYAVGHRLLSGHGRWMAAVLSCGPAAMLSYRCAAALWCLLPTNSRRLDVTVPGGSRRGPAGVAVHRARRLDPEDRGEHDGIPVTSVARTLLDLAGVVDRRRLQSALEAAERLRLFDLAALDRTIKRGRTRPGARMLREALGEYRDPPFTRSELERRFLGLCRAAGLPAPSVNTWVAGGEADMAWPDQRVVVELDSHTFHATGAAFERDRRRDAALQLAGYTALRVTDRRLAREPDVVMRDVATALAAGG